MSTQHLSDYFDGFVIKRLSSVETDQSASNQHEFNGVKELKNLLGTERIEFPARFVYLSDEESEHLSASAQLTWYDARSSHPTRTEFRLYFESNPVLEQASTGDLLFIGKTPNDQLFVVVTEANSSAESQLLWLFRLNESIQSGFRFKEHSQFQQVGISFVERQMLELLGIATSTHQGELLDLILKTFGASFPRTKIFSEFARTLVMNADPIGDPDNTLMRWLDQEEIIFRTLERHIVSEKLAEGFENDVDEFVSYSLGVQNRRKSRAGHAFENHLEFLFVENNLMFSRGSITESKSKPDFIFPGIDAYNDLSFPESGLIMLAAKTTCKDRWRQILTEAERISIKHLVSLEPGISQDQTNQMKSHLVNLVIPKPLHDSFTESQKIELLDCQSLINLIRPQQASWRKYNSGIFD